MNPPPPYRFAWRGAFSNQAMNALHAEAFDHPVFDHDWFGQLQRHSLGWVCAFDADDALVGLVNVPWDGNAHAFIVDTVVADRAQGRGVGTRLIAIAAQNAKAAGCRWLHVDFEESASRFYLDACGFAPTDAGLIDLTRSTASRST
jgi:GNAT superfamily N-acetyltransferase